MARPLRRLQGLLSKAPMCATCLIGFYAAAAGKTVESLEHIPPSELTSPMRFATDLSIPVLPEILPFTSTSQPVLLILQILHDHLILNYKNSQGAWVMQDFEQHPHVAIPKGPSTQVMRL